MLGILGGEGKQENKNEVQEMENYGAEAGSAVKLLEELLNLGYRKNASDIHLEPQEDRMVVRMRLDGMLLHVREYDKEMHHPLDEGEGPQRNGHCEKESAAGRAF